MCVFHHLQWHYRSINTSLLVLWHLKELPLAVVDEEMLRSDLGFIINTGSIVPAMKRPAMDEDRTRSGEWSWFSALMM